MVVDCKEACKLKQLKIFMCLPVGCVEVLGEPSVDVAHELDFCARLRLIHVTLTSKH